MENIKIIDASPQDASLISDAIMAAVGEEIVDSMAGEKSRADVHHVFETLAQREDSQYSYKNTRIALASDGQKAGVCVSYDGGELRKLRRSFFEVANEVFGWGVSDEEVERLPGETNGEEFYLDTLATFPAYRGHGIASALIDDASKKAKKAGLPLGLLVADHNHDARKLYEKRGFQPVGRRPFAGEMMTNMRMPNQ